MSRDTEVTLKVGTLVKVVRGGDDWGWQAYGTVTHFDRDEGEFRVRYEDGQLMTSHDEHEWFPISPLERVSENGDVQRIEVIR